jgi:hypothetical protein
MTHEAEPIEAKALAAAQEYLRLMNERRLEQIASLYADDAEFLGPAGTIRGKVAIDKFYTSVSRELLEPRLPIEPSAIAAVGNQCLLAFNTKVNGRYEPCAVEQFTVNDAGKVVQMIVYKRPGTSDRPRAQGASRSGDET